jgi:predicted  nucleic acid-binding Zn-ribbon protein
MDMDMDMDMDIDIARLEAALQNSDQRQEAARQGQDAALQRQETTLRRLDATLQRQGATLQRQGATLQRQGDGLQRLEIVLQNAVRHRDAALQHCNWRHDAAIERIDQTIVEMKTDIRGLRTDARTDFRVLFGVNITTTLGLAALFAKGFGWI